MLKVSVEIVTLLEYNLEISLSNAYLPSCTLIYERRGTQRIRENPQI